MGINDGKEVRFNQSKEGLKNAINGFFIDGKISLEVKEGLLHAIGQMISSFQEVRNEDKAKMATLLAMSMENLENDTADVTKISNYVEQTYPGDIRLRQLIADFCVSGRQQVQGISYEAEETRNHDIKARAGRLNQELGDLKKRNMIVYRQSEAEENPQFIRDPNRVSPNYDETPKKW